MANRKHHIERMQQVMSSFGAEFKGRAEHLLDDVLKDFCAQRNWRFRRGHFQGRTYPVYETGTINVTKGDPVITGVGTTWSKAYEGGLLVISPASGSDVWRRVDLVSATTSLRLLSPYLGDTDTGLSYKLYQDTYWLPFDCEGVLAGNLWIEGYSDPLLPRDADYIEALTRLDAPSIDDPRMYCDGFVNERLLWSSDDDAGNPGTVAISAGSLTVAGTGTSWDSDLLKVDTTGDVLEGVPIDLELPDKSDGTPDRVRRNGIANVTGATAMQLREAMQHDGGNISAIEYKAGRRGLKKIRLHPVPATAKTFGGLYRRAYMGMFADDDESGVPDEFDFAINALASWYILRQIPGNDAHIAVMRDYEGQAQVALQKAAAKDWSNRERSKNLVRQDFFAAIREGRLGSRLGLRDDYGTFPVSS